MSDASPIELEVGNLIIKTLNIKVDVSEIKPLEPLFGDGLGLDSIDALELSLGVYQTYGYKLRSDGPDNTKIFSCLRSLSEAIEKNRTK